jgi:hypothetical protein
MTARATAQHAIAVVAISFAVVAATACGGDSTGTKDNVNGTYTLRSAANHTLPAIIFQNQVSVQGQPADLTITVNSGSVTLNSNGTFTGTMNLRLDVVTAGGSQTQTGDNPIAGTYTQSGGTITFHPTDQSIATFTAQYSSGTLSGSIDVLATVLTNTQPIPFVFKK